MKQHDHEIDSKFSAKFAHPPQSTARFSSALDALAIEFGFRPIFSPETTGVDSLSSLVINQL